MFVISQLFTCSSIDLVLERLCLEGSRRQAKYAVHALAAITKDDGLKSLSVLYKVSFMFD
jgi:sister-chromatid-cohesion protein PDS5